jgi:Na+(H+)/acetate symporter ActP
MGLARKLGIAIVCGIPAIVGSGFFWELSERWIVVYGYLLLLVITLLVLLFTPRRLSHLLPTLRASSWSSKKSGP